MTKLVFDGIEKELLTRIPEVGARVEKVFGSHYDLKMELPEPYPVFGAALRPLVFDVLSDEPNDELLKRIFSFLEEMANSLDPNVTDLLGIEILEPLTFDRARIQRAWGYMGKRTRELAKETARYGGWLENLPSEEASADQDPTAG